MTQYIDKSVLVAEIERRRDLHYKYYMKNGAGSIAECKYDEDKDILSFINNIEVKGVDFGTEVYKYIDEHFNVYDDGNQTLQTKDKKSLIGMVDVENIAKHFFELGLQVAQKGEEV